VLRKSLWDFSKIAGKCEKYMVENRNSAKFHRIFRNLVRGNRLCCKNLKTGQNLAGNFFKFSTTFSRISYFLKKILRFLCKPGKIKNALAETTQKISAIETLKRREEENETKTTSEHRKKWNIFLVVCFSFFFQCSSHSLPLTRRVCMHTNAARHQYQRTLSLSRTRARSGTNSLFTVCVCVCVTVW